jgi:hypothetical protein
VETNADNSVNMFRLPTCNSHQQPLVLGQCNSLSKQLLCLVQSAKSVGFNLLIFLSKKFVKSTKAMVCKISIFMHPILDSADDFFQVLVCAQLLAQLTRSGISFCCSGAALQKK